MHLTHLHKGYFNYYTIACIIGVIAVLTYLLLCLKSKDLPGESKYNYFGSIGIHLDNICKESRYKLLQYVAESILKGYYIKCPVLFFMDLIKKGNIGKIINFSILN